MIPAIVLIVAAFLTAGVAVYIAWRNANPTWLPLQTTYLTIHYLAPPTLPPMQLARAVTLAIDCLARVWPQQRILDVVIGLDFLVVSSSTWQNLAGTTVGGESDGNVVKVGIDLSSLCHELAHACQLGIDNAVDPNHQSWPGRGITAADNTFRKALSS